MILPTKETAYLRKMARTSQVVRDQDLSWLYIFRPLGSFKTTSIEKYGKDYLIRWITSSCYRHHRGGWNKIPQAQIDRDVLSLVNWFCWKECRQRAEYPNHYLMILQIHYIDRLHIKLYGHCTKGMAMTSIVGEHLNLKRMNGACLYIHHTV